MRSLWRSSLPELTRDRPLRKRTGKTQGIRFRSSPPRKARPVARSSPADDDGVGAVWTAGAMEGAAGVSGFEATAGAGAGVVTFAGVVTGAGLAAAAFLAGSGSAEISYARLPESSITPFNSVGFEERFASFLR